MTFMLGAFTQGLTEGARDIYGLADTSSQTDQRKAQTAALKQQTDFQKQAFDAGQTLAKGGQAIATPTLPTPASSTPTSGGGQAGTTSGPVAPTNFSGLPTPNNMQGVTTGASPQSAPGSASGYGPSYNPEAGPSSAANGQTQQGQNPAPPQMFGGGAPLPGNAPGMVAPPTLGSSYTRPSSSMGDPTSYSNSFTSPQPAGAAVRPIVTTDPTKSNQAIPTNDASTAPSAQSAASPTQMPTYDITPETMNPPPRQALDMSKVTNRPVGAAISDWWNNRSTPAQPMTHGRPPSSADNVGRHIAGALDLKRGP